MFNLALSLRGYNRYIETAFAKKKKKKERKKKALIPPLRQC
jgi:hypothetical protein